MVWILSATRKSRQAVNNRHQAIDVLFDEQKDIQIIQILMRTDSYSTMLEMYAVKKVGFIHIVWPDKAVFIVNISTMTLFKTANWTWKVGLKSETSLLEFEYPENLVGYENQNIAIEAF